MIFEHNGIELPETDQQFLHDVESFPLLLQGDNAVSLRTLHDSYLEGGVEVSDQTPNLYCSLDVDAMLSRLQEKKEHLSSLIDEMKKAERVSLAGNDGPQLDGPRPQQEIPAEGEVEVEDLVIPKPWAELEDLVADIDDRIQHIRNRADDMRAIMRLGEYDPANKKIILYFNNIQAAAGDIPVQQLLAIVYVHECMHAYFDMRCGQDGAHYIREIEEPMAELGMLLYLKNVAVSNSAYDLLDAAVKHVEDKKTEFLACYGYGAYLYSTHLYPPSADACLLLSDYAEKAGRLDADSSDVIKFCVSLQGAYPNPELEVILFYLLYSTILNVGQHQEMSFLDIYESGRKATIEAMWERWEGKSTKFDPVYRKQIEAIVSNNFSENILVESMSPWQATTPIYKGGTNWNTVVPRMWTKSFSPYRHQVAAWEALLSQAQAPYQSMVVTTGTGSGKTECFMAPLVYDVAQRHCHQQTHSVKAIFLYPLNALMEDQKKRLSQMITNSGVDLHFAVYNGNTPHYNPAATTVPDRFEHEMIYREEIWGEMYYNPQTQEIENCARPIYPDIILTNPTMLEFLLLRDKDQALVSASQGELSWVVIDETHTFTGAGADEIAMLLRRVLQGFNVTADDVHFCTSSATIGGPNGTAAIRRFITGITGQSHQSVIGGRRRAPGFSLYKSLAPERKKSIISKLSANGYVYLRDLIPYCTSTEERLAELDKLAACGLKVKVHFYERALTNGLFVDMKEFPTGTTHLTLHHDIPLDANSRLDQDYVRAVYCKDCGAVMANLTLDATRGYHRVTSLSINALDGSYGLSEYETSRFLVPSAAATAVAPNAQPVDVDFVSHQIAPSRPGMALLSNPITPNTPDVCPCCGSKYVGPFNISSMVACRTMAPVLLKNASPAKNPAGLPFEGRQFVSFADSRASAAKPSLAQNLDTEEFWVIDVIYRELLKMKANLKDTILSQLGTLFSLSPGDATILEDLTMASSANSATLLAIANRRGIPVTGKLTWEMALDRLAELPELDRLAECFARKENYDNNGLLTREYLRQYALAALYNVMHRRRRYRFCAEGYGLFRVTYAALLNITQLPTAVLNLNADLHARGLAPVSLDDWRDFLKIYLDFDVRTNERIFFRGNTLAWGGLDISACRNLATEKSKRRSVKHPRVKGQNGVGNRMSLLLARLYGCDKIADLALLDPAIEPLFQPVLDAMFSELERVNLIQIGQCYRQGAAGIGWYNDVLDAQEQQEGFTNYRLNLADLSFELFDSMYADGLNKTVLDVTFRGYSPYPDKFDVYNVVSFAVTPALPISAVPVDYQTTILNNWLTPNHIEYLHCSQLRRIYEANLPVYLQLEHTAQVNRMIASKRLQAFKDQQVNILSCSTTMEMGVDIGELEIVSMANVPPHPANYKQRAGRAGRAAQNKSTCLTVCNSDAVGLAVVDQPKVNLLEREIVVPMASLQSHQILARHFNSFLLREFYASRRGTGLRNSKLYQFFLQNHLAITNNELRDMAGTVYDPTHFVYLTGAAYPMAVNSACEQFRNWLNGLGPIANASIWNGLNSLKQNTSAATVNNIDIIRDTLCSIAELETSFFEMLNTLAVESAATGPWNPARLTPLQKTINYDFISLLNTRVLEYFGTRQFTPNANMPVNIIAIKTDHSDGTSYDDPSRDLRTALAEYAPGSTVIMDGKNYTVAGVEWNRAKPFRHMYRCCNCQNVWEEPVTTTLPICPECADTHSAYMRMIEPVAFLTEEGTTREPNTESSSRVKTALLGSTPWGAMSATNPELYLQRNSANQSGASILYYTDGDGAGYAVCCNPDPRCGRAVVDAMNTPFSYVRDAMSYREADPATGTVHYRHKNLRLPSTADETTSHNLLRNMIIGGSISTDFVEIKPFHKVGLATNPTFESFYTTHAEDANILTTLGILICDDLAAHIPCERRDLDFLLTHYDRELGLCIFDTAKGGAGYSTHLNTLIPWAQVFDRCRGALDKILHHGVGVDSILSRATMRYLENIDVMATYLWLMEEYNHRTPVPNVVRTTYPLAIPSSINALRTAYSSAVAAGRAVLFINSDMDKWNYNIPNASVPNWKDNCASHYQRPGYNVPLVLSSALATVPIEQQADIYYIRSWAALNVLNHPQPAGVHFLAYVSDTLYVTDDAQFARLNGLWGLGNVYAVPMNCPGFQPYNPAMSTVSEIFLPPSQRINSNDLFNLVLQQDHAGQIASFLQGTRGCHLDIRYDDEHVKNQFSMYLAIQFIRALVQQSRCASFRVTFQNEEYYAPNGTDANDPRRGLFIQLRDNEERNTVLQNLMQQLTNDFEVNTLPEKSCTHYRQLVVTDSNGNTLIIKPHGGFASDWNVECRGLNCSNTNTSTMLPLLSCPYNILYTITTR